MAVYPFFQLLVILPNFSNLGKNFSFWVSASGRCFNNNAGALFLLYLILKSFIHLFHLLQFLHFCFWLKLNFFKIIFILCRKNGRKAFHCHLQVNWCSLGHLAWDSDAQMKTSKCAPSKASTWQNNDLWLGWEFSLVSLLPWNKRRSLQLQCRFLLLC